MKKPPPDVKLVQENHCLACGARFNALGTGDRSKVAEPDPGSLVVCIKCGAVSILDDELKPRGFTDQEADELLADHWTMNHLARAVSQIYLLRHGKS